MLLLLYAITVFLHTAFGSNSHETWAVFVPWMKPVMMATPVFSLCTFWACAIQTMSHVQKIREGYSPMKHDRAVQILALPAIFSTMTMSSLARLFEFQSSGMMASPAAVPSVTPLPSMMGIRSVMQHLSFNETLGGAGPEAEEFIIQSETCLRVAELYEAWALYQFAKLTLELISDNLARKERSGTQEQKLVARALIRAHGAVESLAWLGVASFLIVCVMQAGWSVIQLTSADTVDWESYEKSINYFEGAGMISSCAAIYNVHIVESSFDEHLEGFNPLMKFVTVKILVSFAFFQRGIFAGLQVMDSSLPGIMKGVVTRIPFIGDILNFSEIEFELFYVSLLIFECFFVCILHWWAWSADEEWYNEEEQSGRSRSPRKLAEGERQPLVPKPVEA
eukprot:CAMPEP_0170615202 /NCGR_PEP_ID=MMETSP0224-20130122/25211_1 /TAXON_ID=285029 /ORGANISM="Togula jolla, Strain CCCM 725" /LENGTH=393 /DNA_ID=CAMNT_0010940917 /DNA_START=211 /DNA_END=1392 /DNA_ORIENTATION=+